MAEEELDIFNIKCPICLDVYVDPVILTCGHLFCMKCIKNTNNITKTCPMCRCPISNIKKRDDRVKEVKNIMASHYAICHSCGETTVLSRLREHVTACQKAAKNSKKRTPAGAKIIRCGLCQKRIAPNGLLKRLKNNKRRGHSLICPQCALKNATKSRSAHRLK
ncbi:E3 ubiquitin-protein ligase RNF125-like [Centruroides sculpturatus]|uniref:E3 ubiquitin-protein ligase RNF125-like n=1 Tax=Centruroides sculpturatus TaxID=218467 RepID=UPI000C6EC860|nr:E3 ubiquitin-protein ligase RNF125-like [Centruroides sculpturatus]